MLNTSPRTQGAGANILRAVAGAGVLSGYDHLQVGTDLS